MGFWGFLAFLVGQGIIVCIYLHGQRNERRRWFIQGVAERRLKFLDSYNENMRKIFVVDSDEVASDSRFLYSARKRSEVLTARYSFALLAHYLNSSERKSLEPFDWKAPFDALDSAYALLGKAGDIEEIMSQHAVDMKTAEKDIEALGLITRSINSPVGLAMYLSEFRVPSLIDRVRNWFCDRANSNDLQTDAASDKSDGKVSEQSQADRSTPQE